ncbi:hypothetical protein GCM10009843_07230 [Nocardioides bigeumensis]|uniref:Uncharacterized protein n=1 Tax=Nocardioides bigeumensis TaxID=433657 RepID=A0ABP5JKQ5_9ACTN
MAVTSTVRSTDTAVRSGPTRVTTRTGSGVSTAGASPTSSPTTRSSAGESGPPLALVQAVSAEVTSNSEVNPRTAREARRRRADMREVPPEMCGASVVDSLKGKGRGTRTAK